MMSIHMYRPGDLGTVVKLHADYYFTNWGFGRQFEIKVARELAALLDHFSPDRDGFWTAQLDNETIGSIAIDGQDTNSPRLRFFILSDRCRGKGVGKQLMTTAMTFVQERGYQSVYLTTFSGLAAARVLYEQWGFKLLDEQPAVTWGTPVREQTFRWTAPARSANV